MITDPTCTVCGMEEEDGYHAIMRCTKAVALRSRLREIWELPKEEDMANKGKEWALITLSNLTSSMRTKVMLMWWRAWHLRNNIIFGDGKCEIKQSAEFLDNYLTTLTNIREGREEGDIKGKKPILELNLIQAKKQFTAKHTAWKPPDTGWQCLNIDASYIQDSGATSWGAVIRDDHGKLVSTAWALIQNCANAETAEAIACWEGVKHAISVNNSKLVVECDCSNLVAKLCREVNDRSQVASIILDIQRLCTLFDEIKFMRIKRVDNRVAHELARFSRVENYNGVMIGSAPSCTLDLILKDCNHNFVPN
jgi:hypothetical protein